MTSIQYNNRYGVVNGGSTGQGSNKPSIRGRTESPGLRARFPSSSASSRDSQNISRNQRLIPTRNPEKISGNHVEQYQRQLNKVNHNLKPGILTSNHNLTPRGAYTKFDDPNPSLNIKQHIHNSKTRLNDLDNQSLNNNNIMSLKPQKYLNTYTNLNQIGSTTKENNNNYKNNIDDGFKSMSIDSKNKDYYNIITHETQSSNELANERYKVSMGNNNCVTGAPGSLLRASQSKNGYSGSSQAQFYPQQQQQSSNSYKIPTTPASLASVNYQQSQSYYATTKPINQSNLSAESNDLSHKGIVGLKNLGNTCFMNSVLQCLSNTSCLLEYCLSNSYQNELNTTMSVMKGSLFNSYASLIKQMWSGGSIVSLQDFKAQLARFAPRFVGYAQQDAEEFLYYLIKGLHEDVNLICKRPSPFRFDEKAWDRKNDSEKSEEHWAMNLRTDNSRISDMFVGQLKSTLKCTKCEYKSPTFELFWHLAVPIPTKPKQLPKQIKPKAKKKSLLKMELKPKPVRTNTNKLTGLHLDDCIKLFMSEEILDGDNKPTCSRCNEKRRCTKRYTIEKLPKILVIHLKRFLKVRYNNKISSNVDYPIDSLDMSKYLSYNVDPTTTRPANSSNNCIYDLYGISLHSGTESSGHYVAYCKHPYKNKWNYFNDSQVREISKSSLQDSNAYILFYQLRS